MFFVTFRLFVIFCILAQFGAEADQVVKCDYRDYYGDGDYRCDVRNVDLSKKTANEKFSFSGTQEQKKKATLIGFQESGRVAHVPQNLDEEFPKLTRLWISNSEIPIVKNNLLGPQFSWIKELWLRKDKIQIVEEEAFKHLYNLEWIYLHYNKIQSLSPKVFLNNRKLKEIRLYSNKIKIISPETFQHLNQLKSVELRWNFCVDKEIGCYICDTKIDHTKLNRDLHACYENHKKSSDLLNEGENKNFMKIILKSRKPARIFCFQINFRIFEN
jgi:Leucine-rich repeat (LRR) protein